jgi:hypothetical protein
MRLPGDVLAGWNNFPNRLKRDQGLSQKANGLLRQRQILSTVDLSVKTVVKAFMFFIDKQRRLGLLVVCDWNQGDCRYAPERTPPY